MSKKDSMNTMSDCINNLTKKGYSEDFQASAEGIKALSDDTIYEPSNVAISNFYRFEGQSDPSDNAIIYVIETKDGKKGMLIDSYGANANTKISDFVKAVEDFHKKV